MDDNNYRVDECFLLILYLSDWMFFKLSFFEVEFFLNNVKKDIFEFKNLRKVKDNLMREERLVLGKFKFSNNVFRV